MRSEGRWLTGSGTVQATACLHSHKRGQEGGMVTGRSNNGYAPPATYAEAVETRAAAGARVLGIVGVHHGKQQPKRAAVWPKRQLGTTYRGRQPVPNASSSRQTI